MPFSVSDNSCYFYLSISIRKTFKIALVPSPDKSMDTCTVCQTNRGHDYVVMHR